MTAITPFQARTAYARDAILSATPGQLVVMLYDRLELDLARAERAQAEERWPDAGPQLMHAQDVITELQLALRLELWDGAENLFAIYGYVRSALLLANVSHDVERTREAIRLIAPLASAWREVVDMQAEPAAVTPIGTLGVA